MEKFGVACGCASGSPDLAGMTKVADFKRQCPQCGTVHTVGEMKLSSQVQLREQMKVPSKEEEKKSP